MLSWFFLYLFSGSSTLPATTETPHGGFVCKGSGKFSDPSDCQKYIVCRNTEIKEVKRCGYNEVFNPHNGRCTNDWSVCQKTPKCKRHREYIVDPENKHRYFICVRNIKVGGYWIFRSRCSGDKVFDTHEIKCHKSDNDSSDSSDSSDSGSVSSSEEVDCDDKIKFVCEEKGVFPDPNSERKYYECIPKQHHRNQFRRIHRQCKSGDIFGPGICIRKRSFFF